MHDHLDIICKERSVQCLLCNGKVKGKSLAYHWMNNCKEYYIQYISWSCIKTCYEFR